MGVRATAFFLFVHPLAQNIILRCFPSAFKRRASISQILIRSFVSFLQCKPRASWFYGFVEGSEAYSAEPISNLCCWWYPDSGLFWRSFWWSAFSVRVVRIYGFVA